MPSNQRARSQTKIFPPAGEQVKALSLQTDLAYQSYYGGVTPYLEALDSDRQLFESELRLTQDRANEFLPVIALYRALGDGWKMTANLRDLKPQIPLEWTKM